MERTDPPHPRPSHDRPTVSTIIDAIHEPVTVEDCQDDYAQGADERAAFDERARRTAPDA